MADSHPLRKWLESHGRSDTDFAREIGISPSYFSLILRGKRKVSLDLAIRIERATARAITPWILHEAASGAARQPAQ